MMMSGKCFFLILAVLVAADLLAGGRSDACAPTEPTLWVTTDGRVKASDGCLYLVLNTTSGNWASRSVLEIWRSADDGANWTPWRVLEKERAGEFSYPCIIEPQPGTLVVTYTWKRQRIAFVEMPVK